MQRQIAMARRRRIPDYTVFFHETKLFLPFFVCTSLHLVCGPGCLAAQYTFLANLLVLSLPRQNYSDAQRCDSTRVTWLGACQQSIDLRGQNGYRPCTLCYVLVLPGRKSAFRVGFWPACCRESTEIGAFGQPEGPVRCSPGSSPAEIRSGMPIYGPEALLHNIEYVARRCTLPTHHESGTVGAPAPPEARRCTLCAIVLPGFRVGFRPDSIWENVKIGPRPPAGLG
jgi:hypothetical protein